AKEILTVYHVEDNHNGAQKAGPAITSVKASDFLKDPHMQDDVFGPFTMIIRCKDPEEMREVGRRIHGQLGSTVRGTDDEVANARELLAILREKAGRLIFNGVPTGVEVCRAQVHGGPYPATTDSRFTAVGQPAIRRWLRPVAYQNCPQAMLPE